MTDPFLETTYSVSELCEEIRDLLAGAFRGLWVAGEVQRLNRSRRGHLYFELVEKGADDEVVGKLDAVAWRTDHLRIARTLRATGQQVSEGLAIRCRVEVSFYPQGGRLQVVVREVDPVFSLGDLERRRRELLAELAAEDLLERNRRLLLDELPLALALVTSEGSAAYHDFLTTLRESPYRFRVLFVHAAVQGRTAEREIASALESLAGAGVGGEPLACVAVVRGGGSRADLAAFDSRGVARAIARSPVPVITGLGHQIDEAIADRVPHTVAKTPTKAAELLVERVAEADRRVADVGRRLRSAAKLPLAEASQALAIAERQLARAGLRLESAELRLADRAGRLTRAARARLAAAAARPRRLARRLASAAPRVVARRRPPLEVIGRLLHSAADHRIGQARATVRGLERLCEDLSPRRTLARGFTITRSSEGETIRSPRAVRGGARIRTETAAGSFDSRVVSGRVRPAPTGGDDAGEDAGPVQRRLI